MIDAQSYRQRREVLAGVAKDGLVVLCGHELLPRNYPANVFPFRQNSHVLYYCGISRPGIALVVDGSGEARIFGPPEDIDDVVWHGPHDTLEDEGRRAGIETVEDIAKLGDFLKEQKGAGRRLHWLAPYQADRLLWFAELMGTTPAEIRSGSSTELTEAIAGQRVIKSDDEVAEIENALEVTARMHTTAMAVCRPGILEAEVAAVIQDIALADDRAQSYNPIVTVRGEVLHNNVYANRLEEGQLMLNDSGAESPLFYASDITRTFPVSGTFDERQKALYQVVLDAQLASIDACTIGTSYKDVHLLASRTMAKGLMDLGLMKGDVNEAVSQGAHALFFPHGLGHMLGLDVHDMEDLGDIVGYAGHDKRSDQFGLGFLRMSRPLQEGFVFTVEPGIYFIPALIDRWREEKKHEAFIDYDAVNTYRDFGGIRIEDDVLCTADGPRVLGPGIPKSVAEVEEAMAG